MKTKVFNIILIIALILTAMPSNIMNAYGAEYEIGQSLIAKDQEKASKGLKFPGLDITWLDLGENQISSLSQMDKFSEGIFNLDLANGIICFDTSGKIIAIGDYAGVYDFSDGMAKVYKYLPPVEPYVPGRIMAPPGRIVGFIDKDGNEVIPIGKLHSTSDKFHEGFAVIGPYDGNKGYINKLGEIVIPQIFKNAGDFSQGLAAVQDTETNLWGYIDKEGELVIPMLYQDAEPFRENVAYVVKDGKAGYIDKEGNTVIDFNLKPESDIYTDNGFYNGLAIAQDSSGKYGYIDKSGEFFIPAIYKSVNTFNEDATLVYSANQNYPNGYGSGYLIDRSGKRLTPLWKYGSFYGETMREGLIRVLSSYGPSSKQYIVMLNKYGAEVIPSNLDLEYISSFNEGYALVIAYNNGETAVGLAKKPDNINDYKSAQLIRVFIDGKLLEFTDTDPIIESSRTLVPMRAIFEALGAEIKWDDASKTVSGTKDGITVSLKIGDKTAYINGKPVELDVPAKIKNSRTIVPLRFIAESFDTDVTWDGETQSVFITSHDKEQLYKQAEALTKHILMNVLKEKQINSDEKITFSSRDIFDFVITMFIYSEDPDYPYNNIPEICIENNGMFAHYNFEEVQRAVKELFGVQDWFDPIIEDFYDKNLNEIIFTVEQGMPYSYNTYENIEISSLPDTNYIEVTFELIDFNPFEEDEEKSNINRGVYKIIFEVINENGKNFLRIHSFESVK